MCLPMCLPIFVHAKMYPSEAGERSIASLFIYKRVDIGNSSPLDRHPSKSPYLPPRRTCVPTYVWRRCPFWPWVLRMFCSALSFFLSFLLLDVLLVGRIFWLFSGCRVHLQLHGINYLRRCHCWTHHSLIVGYGRLGKNTHPILSTLPVLLRPPLVGVTPIPRLLFSAPVPGPGPSLPEMDVGMNLPWESTSLHLYMHA
ncbi:hypothetical protein F4861DRAFT_205680 [Xylaria intraflava]|nr:hypothetical protein F4861DRAFT_205680 [Xylaria intraflava]